MNKESATDMAWLDKLLMATASDDALRIYALAGVAIILFLSLRLAWKARWQITGVPARAATTRRGTDHIREQLGLLKKGKDAPLTSFAGFILFAFVVPSLLVILVLHFAPWLTGAAAAETASPAPLADTAKFVLSQFAMGSMEPTTNPILDGILIAYRYLIGAVTLALLHLLYVLIRFRARREGLITSYKRLLGEPEMDEVLQTIPAHTEHHEPVHHESALHEEMAHDHGHDNKGHNDHAHHEEVHDNGHGEHGPDNHGHGEKAHDDHGHDHHDEAHKVPAHAHDDKLEKAHH